jgi:hypothetical protein
VATLVAATRSTKELAGSIGNGLIIDVITGMRFTVGSTTSTDGDDGVESTNSDDGSRSNTSDDEDIGETGNGE